MKTLNLYGAQDIRYEEKPNPVVRKEDEVVKIGRAHV